MKEKQMNLPEKTLLQKVPGRKISDKIDKRGHANND
jgi:hypothetical protein